MNISDAYTQFFMKSEEGRHFVDQLEKLITENHEKSENTPDSARDYSQRAKGVREVLSHIRVSTTKPKKGAKS